jgi:hypothetical protein
MWSISPLVRTTEMTGECLLPDFGCNALIAPICSRISGEQLISTQLLSSTVTPIDDWVRRFTRASPFQNSAQTGHKQFHWGEPPPAADPRMRAFTIKSRADFSTRSQLFLKLSREIIVDFHANANFCYFWCQPLHGVLHSQTAIEANMIVA